MILAVDSSVLLAIVRGEPTADTWVNLLAGARATGQLVAGEVVWAETRQFFASRAEHSAALAALGVRYCPLEEAGAALAGELHAAYRRAGGTRTRLVGDFLIGAHAATQAQALASADEGFFRKYFRGLRVVTV